MRCEKSIGGFAFIVLLLTAFSGVYAQGNKTTECMTWEYGTIDCVDEEVSGEIEMCATIFNSGKFQIKWKGELVGEDTGSIYSAS